MSFEYYIYYIYYTILGFPFSIKVALFSICVFIPFLIITSFKLTHSRMLYYHKGKLQHVLKKKYSKKIKDIITSENDYSHEEVDDVLNCNVKKLTTGRKIYLTNSILNISEQEKYVNNKNYQQVIKYFGLRQFWEKKLQYGSAASKHRALRKLDDLNIEIPGSIITSLTYNRDEHLRKKARSSYMYFSENNPFKFLDENFDKTFNDWDKIEIHNVLSRRVNERLPNLTQWIRNSNNSEFQCFLIDEIKYFNRTECSQFLLGMIDNQDLNLRRHIIDALGEMKYQEAEEHFVKDYILQPQMIQQSIIIAIQKINTGKALPFLEEAYNNAHAHESKMIILRAIYSYGESGKEVFYEMRKIKDGFSKLLFEHVSNSLIKYN